MNEKINTENSTFRLEGTIKEQLQCASDIKRKLKEYETDRQQRVEVYRMRRDFYIGDHGKYSNIVGRTDLEKKGHANAVVNYAGKTIQKIAMQMANNGPTLDFPLDQFYSADDEDVEIEEVRTQNVEIFIDEVLKRNKFKHRAYRRACFNQSQLGDFAIKIYPYSLGEDENGDEMWEFRIVNHENLDNLIVGWRGDDSRAYDFVIVQERRSVQSLELEYGITIPDSLVSPMDKTDRNEQTSAHNDNQQWGLKQAGGSETQRFSVDAKSTAPSVLVTEYDDEEKYAIQIGDQLVQYVKKDGTNYPRTSFWIIGENIPNPGHHWSISDIDQVIPVNIELNESSNDERDYVRVGARQSYIAYNMPNFNPEQFKARSGIVIKVNDPMGNARFEPLAVNTNTYPVDVYLNRMKKHIHDMSLPEVTFGAGSSVSGRAKALDYQTMVDLIDFKRGAWEIVIMEMCEKLQLFGYFYFGHEYFEDAKTSSFKVRYPEFDWTDVVPITESDKIVNVLNKFQMGLPFKYTFKELGYKNPGSVVSELKKEMKDPDLVLLRAKMYQLMEGTVQAQMRAQAMGGMGEENPMGDVNAQNAGSTLTSSQNDGRESNLPMSVRGGTTSTTTPQGQIATERQNVQAQGNG